MRARDRDVPDGAGARHGLRRGIVGTGDALVVSPETIDAALASTSIAHGRKAARMLRRFADLPDGVFVWTRSGPQAYHLGRITGAWRYDDSPDARAVGIHHVRPTRWLERRFTEVEAPDAVAATFARGGRNFQRTHDERAECRTAELWSAYGPDCEGDHR